MSINQSKYMNTDASPPNTFRAAENNDVEELLAALKDWQSLSDRDARFLNRTPVHIAAAKSSNDFLASASQQESFDPHLRDDNLRTAFDHADAYCNERGKKILFDSMYDDLRAPDDRYIDYSDNEPSPFFPSRG
ncbi:hypothetical protein [Paracoccus isoporae]|uniref:hypothetical protein n=1 Tax=Paracoccus isoporae TaxID=591205 RepID=UPI00115FB3C0|nr:hypothetical protein [Paracoccus isoporae]